ncbi:MAG: hypothetical protein KAS59_04540 [Alphaproteobacteria bacterium]|nr:hypothetical protein [Alphaproteobacteria bacterium]
MWTKIYGWLSLLYHSEEVKQLLTPASARESGSASARLIVSYGGWTAFWVPEHVRHDGSFELQKTQSPQREQTVI